ncbi:hypothetical protein CJ030_MR0G005444 [Morella rubra]|uniref:Uncharacterized protein n=1 Tax=Morella rubra TaxID=262757 RepID=A0A6A1ULC8_9ROSI|nr:hypothetical protein CJ030_MR0G005444 [Morella rubra]
MDPSKIYLILHQEERQRLLHLPSPQLDAAAMAANQISFRPPDSSSHSRGRPKCSYCDGHWQEQCYRLHGFPPGHRNASRAPPGSADGHFGSSNSAHQVSTSGTFSDANGVSNLKSDLIRQLMKFLNFKNTPPLNTDTPPINFAGNIASYNSVSLFSNTEWFIEYRASDHMVSQLSSLTNINFCA